jgi:hypothetical protein
MRTGFGIVVAICMFLAGAAAAKAAPLTDDTLKAMLENLGYSVTVTGDKPPRHFKVDESAPVNGLDFTITFDLSSDKDATTLWIYAGLYEIPADKPAPSSALLALLAKNDEIGPIFFSYATSNKLLYLNAPTANVDITPVLLRQKIKNFIAKMDSTYSLWNVANGK